MSQIDHDDPLNAQILAFSEDKIPGFVREPFREISRLSGVPLETVLERIRVMLAAGTIRRVRQTLVATQLAEGALVAWSVPEEKLNGAFDFMFKQDPFSGHVVIRSTDPGTAGSEFRLWTTLKVPVGFPMEEHARVLMRHTGCERFKLMPAKGIFALGVGHVRRKTIEPGDKADEPAKMLKVEATPLTDLEWQGLVPLKREFALGEITNSPWGGRAQEGGGGFGAFFRAAENRPAKKGIGPFS